jgi:glycosyltransferase involved in cell wall biosynthesis
MSIFLKHQLMNEFINKYQKAPIREYPHEVLAQPFVSVCVQTYQHADYIKQCLDGILMQKTDFPFEILLGEDESTDGTREICIDYAIKYPDKIRLFLHSRENVIFIGGIPTGRFNMLYNLQESSGKYIALCEGDDYWTDPYKLQKQVDILEANEEFVLCFHNAEIIYENTISNERKLFRKYDKNVYTAQENIYKWIIPTASVLFTNVIPYNQKPAYFDNLVHGDFGLFMWLGEFGKFYCINEVMSVYRKHDASIMTSFNNINSIEKLINQYKNMKDFFGAKYQRDFDKRISSYYIQLSIFQIKEKMFSQGLKSVLTALSFDIYIFCRNKKTAEYLKYSTFNILITTLFLTLYKSQSIIRRSKLKSLFKWPKKLK